MNIVDEVIKAYGGVNAVKERFNYTTVQGVYRWRHRGIPYKHQIDIHREKGFCLDKLRSSCEKLPS